MSRCGEEKCAAKNGGFPAKTAIFGGKTAKKSRRNKSLREKKAAPADQDARKKLYQTISFHFSRFLLKSLEKGKQMCYHTVEEPPRTTPPAHSETANSGVQPNGPDLAGLHTVNAHYMQQQAAPLSYCTTFPSVLQEERCGNCESDCLNSLLALQSNGHVDGFTCRLLLFPVRCRSPAAMER